ncbi:MAG: hemerythrin domain-containing protein [Candidatus Kryptoniota bacterium]
MNAFELLHKHHQELMRDLQLYVDRVVQDAADASLLLSYSNEYLISHAEAEEILLYSADEDKDFINGLIREHKEIKQGIDVIDGAFSRGDVEHVVTEAKYFMELLLKHFGVEENQLLPHLREKLSDEDFQKLIEESHAVEFEKRRSDVWSLYEYDHKRIDLNLSRLKREDLDTDRAVRLYAKLRAQLLTHIELEESVLFPAFIDIAPPEQHGPIQVMIDEHRVITSYISAPSEKLDIRVFLDGIDNLGGKLATHNKKEELILYPMINRSLPKKHKIEVFRESFKKFVQV